MRENANIHPADSLTFSVVVSGASRDVSKEKERERERDVTIYICRIFPSISAYSAASRACEISGLEGGGGKGKGYKRRIQKQPQAEGLDFPSSRKPTKRHTDSSMLFSDFFSSFFVFLSATITLPHSHHPSHPLRH